MFIRTAKSAPTSRTHKGAIPSYNQVKAATSRRQALAASPPPGVPHDTGAHHLPLRANAQSASPSSQPRVAARVYLVRTPLVGWEPLCRLLPPPLALPLYLHWAVVVRLADTHCRDAAQQVWCEACTSMASVPSLLRHSSFASPCIIVIK